MDKANFLDEVERKCNSLIREYIRDNNGIDLDEAKEELSELHSKRDRLKELAVNGLITIEEAKQDMVPINAEIERLSFKLDSTDKTRELNRQIRESLKQFIEIFDKFSFTESIENADLKKIIKEIKIVSVDEIYVYFNISEDVEGFNFPILLSGTFLMPPVDNTDTNADDRT